MTVLKAILSIFAIGATISAVALVFLSNILVWP